MVYSVIAISVLCLVILITAYLGWKSKQESEPEKIVEKETFESVLKGYFEEDNREDYYYVYQKLMKKISELLNNPEMDSDHIEGCRMLAEEFKKFCKATEEKVFARKILYESSGEKNKEYVEMLQNMQEPLMRSVLNSAEKALESKRLFRILKINVEYVYDAMLYYRDIQPSESKYERTTTVLRQLYKK